MKVCFITTLIALTIHCFSTAQCPDRPSAALRLVGNDICFGQSISTINVSEERGNDVYYVWEWGDGTKDIVQDKSPQTHTYNQPINFCVSVAAGGLDYKITLRMVNRIATCYSHASTSEVFIYASPQANFMANDVCIVSPTVSFMNTTCPRTNREMQFLWDFGDPASGAANTSTEEAPKHTYPSAVQGYTVTLTATSFCGSNTIKKNIRVISNPIASAEYPIQPVYCLPYTMEVKTTSISSTGSIWKITPDSGWAFVDGTTNIYSNPTIRFNKKGDYKLYLTSTSLCGPPSQWESQTISVRDKIKITLDTLSGACIPFIFTPKVKVIDDGGMAPEYLWTFNNAGQTSTSYNLNPGTINFPNPGASSVQFKATNACSDTTILQDMQLAGTLNITFPNFKDKLCDIDSLIKLKASPTGGKWSGTGVAADGTMKPAALGIGSYPLKYTFSQGTCRDSQYVTVSVVGTTVKAEGEQDVCKTVGEGLLLRGGTPAGGSWSGRGVTDTLRGLFEPTLLSVGEHEVTYTYRESASQCPNIATKTITVHAPPKANIDTISGFCSNAPKIYNHRSQGAIDFKWLFGDGDSSSLEKPVRAYRQEGTFDLKLIVRNFQNCYDTAYKKIAVLSAPSVAFDISKKEGCTPLDIIFNNRTQGNNVSYLWDFGNGLTSSSKQPNTVTYRNTIDKDTTFKVYLNALIPGCSAIRDSQTVTVYTAPKANFGMDAEKGCSPLTVGFNNISTGSPRAYFWDFRNGKTSKDIVPSSQLFTTDSFSRNFTVKLVVSNTCKSDSIEKNIAVTTSLLRPFFSVSQVAGCEPLTVNFTNFSSSGSNVTYDFGDGNRYTNPNPTYIFEKAGTYTVKQYASGVCGGDSVQRTINVYANPKAKFTYLQNNACHDYRVQFKSTDLQGVNLLWDFGDSTQNGSNNPLHDFKKAGNYKVILKAETIEYTCKNADTVSVEVKPPLRFKIDSIIDSKCYGVNTGAIVIRRGDVTGGALKYAFSLNDSTFKDSTTSGVFSGLKGREFYTVWVRDTANCKDSVRVFINGRLPLSIDVGGSTREVDLGDSVLVFVQGNVREPLNVKWEPPVGVSCPTCEQVFIRPKVTTIYTINAADKYGCKERIFLNVAVNTKRRIFVPNTFSPNDDGFNDVFMPHANLSVEKVNYLRIFNRWGEPVFERTHFLPDDRSASWDGKFRGTPLEPNVFIYVMEVELINGEIEILKGDLTLLR